MKTIPVECQEARIPVFVKQLGSDPTNPAQGRRRIIEGRWIKDRKGGKMEEWPEDLRVREFPA